MASTAKIRELGLLTRSVHGPKKDTRVIDEQVQNIKSAIDAIITMMNSLSGLPKDLEENLDIISQFFREQKFTTIILPVLEQISSIDTDIWKDAKQGDTQMPMIPKAFENMKASTIEVKDNYGTTISPLEHERELALLSVYGISLEILGQTLRTLSKNSA